MPMIDVPNPFRPPAAVPHLTPGHFSAVPATVRAPGLPERIVSRVKKSNYPAPGKAFAAPVGDSGDVPAGPPTVASEVDDILQLLAKCHVVVDRIRGAAFGEGEGPVGESPAASPPLSHRVADARAGLEALLTKLHGVADRLI